MYAASDVIIIARVRLNVNAPVQCPPTRIQTFYTMELVEKEDINIEVFSIKDKWKEAIFILMSNG